MSKAVEQLETLLHDQPHNPLRPVQVEEYAHETTRLRDIVNAPPYLNVNRGRARQTLQRVEKMLEDQAPKPISEPVRKDQVARAANALLTETILPAMLTHEEMRRNPAGAVDQFLKRENSKPIKRAILAWKRAQWALEPETQDRDHTNLERFRPQMRMPPGSSSFMVNAQIPGHFAMTPEAKEHWPFPDPSTTAIANAGYMPPDNPVDVRDLREVVIDKSVPFGKIDPLSPEAAIRLQQKKAAQSRNGRASIAKAHAARMAKIAERKQRAQIVAAAAPEEST